MGGRRQSIYPLLAKSLKGSGCDRINDRVFKLKNSSTEVEHFLYARLIMAGELFELNFGMRNREAEEFAINCMRSHGGEAFKWMRRDERFDCSMRFSLGRLAHWGRYGLLVVSRPDLASTVARVEHDIQEILMPFIEGVCNLEALMQFLKKDALPCEWIYTNGAIRMAEILYIARKVGFKISEIEELASSLKKHIAGSLGKDADPVAYFDHVVRSVEKHES